MAKAEKEARKAELRARWDAASEDRQSMKDGGARTAPGEDQGDPPGRRDVRGRVPQGRELHEEGPHFHLETAYRRSRAW